MDRLIWLSVAFAVLAVVRGQQSCQTSERRQGTCISIKDCPDQLALFRQIQAGTAPPGALASLRRNVCAILNNNIRVCCERRQPLVGVTGRPLVLGTTDQPPDPASLLPTDCGVAQLVDRIVNGVDAPLLAWPWMVRLRTRARGATNSAWTCGGVLISDRYVLTAAHCVHVSVGTDLEFVRIGEHKMSTNPDCEKNICAPRFQDINVEEIIIHESYNPTRRCSRCDDIALLRLATPAVLNVIHVVPICVPRNIEEELAIVNRNYTGRFGWVAGWGTVDPDAPIFPDVLQEALLPMGDQFCNLANYPDKNMVLCAGGNGTDSCRGDSGGPIIVSNRAVTKQYVLGVISKGPRFCGSPRTRGIYTNVSFYYNWILSKLRP